MGKIVKSAIILFVMLLSFSSNVFALDILEEVRGVYDSLEEVGERGYATIGEGLNVYSENTQVLRKYLKEDAFEEAFASIKKFVDSYDNGLPYIRISDYFTRDNGVFTFYMWTAYGWIYEIVSSEDKFFEMIPSKLKREDLILKEGEALPLGKLEDVSKLQNYFNAEEYEKIKEFFGDDRAKIVGYSEWFHEDVNTYCYVTQFGKVYKIEYNKDLESLNIIETDLTVADAYYELYINERESID